MKDYRKRLKFEVPKSELKCLKIYRFPSFRPGSGSGMTARPESSLFKQLQIIWTLAFACLRACAHRQAGVTTFYGLINFSSL